MITQEQYGSAVEQSLRMLQEAGLAITAAERERLEVADFGLGELNKTGLEILTYVNTERVCAKEIIMFPHQTCPEHWHPTLGAKLGKEETFRCRWGTVYLYVPGAAAPNPSCHPPEGSEAYYKSRHEVILNPADQYTLDPDTPHWFQAGPEGAIVSEFSTRSTDDQDQFSDPRIKRALEVTPSNQ
jgi:D-lyxose ketol-isomerase